MEFKINNCRKNYYHYKNYNKLKNLNFIYSLFLCLFLLSFLYPYRLFHKSNFKYRILSKYIIFYRHTKEKCVKLLFLFFSLSPSLSRLISLTLFITHSLILLLFHTHSFSLSRNHIILLLYC